MSSNKTLLSERLAYYEEPCLYDLIKRKTPDAYQFIVNTLQNYRHAQITQRLINSICDDIAKHRQADNTFYNDISINICGKMFSGRELLDKSAKDWLGYIIQAADSTIQFLNAALALDLPMKGLPSKEVCEDLKRYPELEKQCGRFHNETLKIRHLNNYIKHMHNVVTVEFFSPDIFDKMTLYITDPLEPKTRDKKGIALPDLIAQIDTLVEITLDIFDTAIQCDVSDRVTARFYLTKTFNIDDENLEKVDRSECVAFGLPASNFVEIVYDSTTKENGFPSCDKIYCKASKCYPPEIQVLDLIPEPHREKKKVKLFIVELPSFGVIDDTGKCIGKYEKTKDNGYGNCLRFVSYRYQASKP